MFYISSLLRPKVDTDSPYIVHPITTDSFPGELNNTFQTNIMFSASKEGQRKICTHVVHNGYVINFYIVYEEKQFLKLFFSIIHEKYMQMWEVFFFNIRIFLSIYEGVKVMKYVSKSTLPQQHQRNRQPRYWYFYYIYTISKSLQSLINNKIAKMTSIMIHIFYISFFLPLSDSIVLWFL